MQEVRFDRMVPAMVVARRDECNLAYLPVGALEWHGLHMPFGTDTFTVSYIAEEAAKRWGGIAFPPLYYGDVRYLLSDCRLEWRNAYTESMDIPREYPEAFGLENEDGSYGYDCPTRADDGEAAQEPLPFSRQQQERTFERLIAYTMLEIHLYGFRNILLLPGHGPNTERCSNAEKIYRENVLRRSAWGPPARTLTYMYIEAGKESEPLLNNHWIHADKWEGSITMIAAPGTVNQELLPDDPDTIPPAYLGHPYLNETDGYNPEHKDIWHSFDALDPRNASEEYGREQMEAVMEKFGQVVADLMKDAPEGA